MPSSQSQLLFHEILHPKEPLVGSLAYFHVGTEKGGHLKTSLHVLTKVKVIHLEGKAKEPPIDAAESCRWEFYIIAVSFFTFGKGSLTFPIGSYRHKEVLLYLLLLAAR